jgi:hypothetical protein
VRSEGQTPSDPPVSFAVIGRDEAEKLAESTVGPSLQGLDQGQIEILYVADGSRDGSVAIARSRVESRALHPPWGRQRGTSEFDRAVRARRNHRPAGVLEGSDPRDSATLALDARRPARGLAGTVAAFGFSLAVGFMLELADPVVVSSDHVETALGLPVLGSVSRIS